MDPVSTTLQSQCVKVDSERGMLPRVEALQLARSFVMFVAGRASGVTSAMLDVLRAQCDDVKFVRAFCAAKSDLEVWSKFLPGCKEWNEKELAKAAEEKNGAFVFSDLDSFPEAIRSPLLLQTARDREKNGHALILNTQHLLDVPTKLRDQVDWLLLHPRFILSSASAEARAHEACASAFASRSEYRAALEAAERARGFLAVDLGGIAPAEVSRAPARARAFVFVTTPPRSKFMLVSPYLELLALFK